MDDVAHPHATAAVAFPVSWSADSKDLAVRYFRDAGFNARITA